MTLKFAKSGKHKGQYILVSKSNPKKVLRIFGTHKPSQEELLREERRIQYFKHHMQPY